MKSQRCETDPKDILPYRKEGSQPTPDKASLSDPHLALWFGKDDFGHSISGNTCDFLQAALEQSSECLRAQKLLTEAAEARVAGALSNAGKTKSDLQTNLHNATTEVKNLSSQLQECQQKLSAASDELTGCQSAHHLKEKAAQEKIASLRATVARAESMVQVKPHFLQKSALILL